MDGLNKQPDNAAIAIVARDFEPTRIEQELLARTFDLVSEMRSDAPASHQTTTDQFLVERSSTTTKMRRRAA